MALLKGVNFKLSATNTAGPAFSSFNRGLQGVANAQRAVLPLQRSWNAGLNAQRRAVQQFGFQMSDFAIQIAGGQSAMLAFTQQGGQMLQFFGPAGAIAAALLAVFGSLAIAITRSGMAMNDLYPYLGVLESEFRGIANAIRYVGEMMSSIGQWIIQNLDQIAITVALVVGWFGAKWVVAMIAASGATTVLMNMLRALAVSYVLVGAKATAAMVATSAFTGALNVLRTALIRLGLPAIIILAGYLIERFLTLVKGAGGFGEALGLLADVAGEAFGRVRLAIGTIPLAMAAASQKMKSYFLGALATMAQAFFDFMADITDGLNRAFNLNLPTLGGSMAGYIRGVADEADAAAGAASAELTAAVAAVTAPLESLERLREAMRNGETEIPPFVPPAETVDGGGSSGGRSPTAELEEIADDAKRIFDDLQSTISESFLSGFKALASGAKSFLDVTAEIFTKIADKVIDILMTPIFDSLGGSLAGGILGGLRRVGIPGFATGTSYAPGGMTVVGERGPELVNLPRGSQVVTNSRTERMLASRQSSPSITINAPIDARGADPSVVPRLEAALAKLRREIPDIIRRQKVNPLVRA